MIERHLKHIRLWRFGKRVNSVKTGGPILTICTSYDVCCARRCLSDVGLSDCHSSEPCNNGWTDRDAVWIEDSGGPKEPRIRWGVENPRWEGAILRGDGRPIVKYRDILRSSAQKRLNRSRCRLGCGLGWAQGITCYMGVQIPARRGNYKVKRRPVVKYTDILP